MDEAVNKSLERLDQQILIEQNNRDSELTSLQGSFSKAEEALKHSISLMEDQANQDLVAVRESLKSSHEELMDASNTAQAQLLELALMFDEVALRLRGTES